MRRSGRTSESFGGLVISSGDSGVGTRRGVERPRVFRISLREPNERPPCPPPPPPNWLEHNQKARLPNRGFGHQHRHSQNSTGLPPCKTGIGNSHGRIQRGVPARGVCQLSTIKDLPNSAWCSLDQGNHRNCTTQGPFKRVTIWPDHHRRKLW